MRVYVERNGYPLFYLLYKAVSSGRQKQVRHILYADYICAHLFKDDRAVDEVLLAVDGADGIAESRLYRAAVFLTQLGYRVEPVLDPLEQRRGVVNVERAFIGYIFAYIGYLILIFPKLFRKLPIDFQ